MVIGAQESETAHEVLIETAERLGCPLTVYGQDFLAYEENGRMVYQDEDGLMDLPLPRLPGRHQYCQCRRGDRRGQGGRLSTSARPMPNAPWPRSTGRAACSACRRAP